MEVRYKILLLDADDTLFDFQRTQRHAFNCLLAAEGVEVCDELYGWYRERNAYYWSLLEQGKITLEETVVARFEDVRRRLNLHTGAAELNENFQARMRESSFLLDGAKALCRELSRHCVLVLATNGVGKTQRLRLKQTGLDPYFSHVVISEEIGAFKPDPAFFRSAFSLCGNPPKGEVLMAGDSLASDMAGGIGFGIDTCWLNAEKREKPSDLPVTYVISELRELRDIVLGKSPAVQK